MKHIIAFVMSIMVVGLCGMDTHKERPHWVKNASVLHVYSKKGTLYAKVPVKDDTSVYDVKNYLKDDGVVSDETSYSLNPLYNGWFRFGYWGYSTTQFTGIYVKDAMQTHNTQSVWIDRHPTKVFFED